MNILFITPDFYPNSTGFANASVNLISAILKHGSLKYNIYVFTEQELGSNKEFEGISILRYVYKGPSLKLGRLLREKDRYRKVKEYIEANEIDVIFFETNTFPFLQNWIVKDFKEKVFVRIHSTADTEVPIYGKHPTIGSKISFWLMKSFMVEVQNILATSNYYLDFIKREYLGSNVYTIWDNKSYGILYNTSIDGSKKAPAQMKNNFLTMGKMSSNGVTQKGITDLIRAVYYLRANNEIDDYFSLKIVGDGEQYSYMNDLVRRYGLERNIELIKAATHDEVFEMISNSKAIILLSRYEGQSMFVTESLALGKPVILSDNNGMSDMVIDGQNGYITKVGSPIMAAKSIKRMMLLGEEEIDKMGEVSRSIYETLFSPHAVYKQFDYLMSIQGDKLDK